MRILNPSAGQQLREIAQSFPSTQVLSTVDDRDLTPSDTLVKCQSDRREVSVSLPRAATCPGTVITVYNVGKNKSFVKTRGGDMINGMNKVTIDAYGAKSFAADEDGSAWLMK